MEETLETLSLPDQVLDADYYKRVLSFTDKAVIAAPCGWGKTRGIVEYIARHWMDGILYVAERKQQLEDMKDLMVEHGVCPDVIGVYHGDSPDTKSLRQDGDYKHIALVTHARMMIYAPDEYLTYESRGARRQRQLLIVDESIAPLLIMHVPKFFVQGLLTEMALSWDDLGQLSPVEIDERVSRIKHILTAHARKRLSDVGIRYQEWTNSLPRLHQATTDIIRHAYYLMVYEILQDRYICHRDEVDILIPLAPHLCWFTRFPQTLVLDATAHITDYLYDDYTVLTPGKWNYDDVESCIKMATSVGNQTKTKLKKYKEIFLQDLEMIIPGLIEDSGFEDAYAVTYKHLGDDNEYLPQVIHQKFGIPVQHYGNTRGSNAFRDKSSVMLLGAYRTPPDFDYLASMLYPRYNPYKHATAHWVQELYRSRIRNHNSEKLQLAVLGEEDIFQPFRHEVGRVFPPFVTCSALDLDACERILQGKKKQTRRELFKCLREENKVNVSEFAKEHAQRKVNNVWRALDMLVQDIPQLKDHIEGKPGDEYIRVVEKSFFTK